MPSEMELSKQDLSKQDLSKQPEADLVDLQEEAKKWLKHYNLLLFRARQELKRRSRQCLE